MNLTITKKLIIVVVAALSHASHAIAGQLCKNTGSVYVCVEWTGSDPVEDVDVRFDFSDATKPDVEFLTGSTSWQVYAQASPESASLRDLGDITIDPEIDSTEDFHLLIKHPTNSLGGARDVESITLTDTDWTGHSLIASDSKLFGDLNGDLVLAKDSGGTGGEADGFTISGDLLGNVDSQV
jgi:hypothetical protein